MAASGAGSPWARHMGAMQGEEWKIVNEIDMDRRGFPL